MELSQLEAFLEAVERGSFRRAAEALLLAQPSISARIQRLEDELGVPLFHRMARGVRLTDMGRTFLPFAQRFVESLRRGTEVLESVRHASAGILNMATARVIGTYVLPGILREFQRHYPETDLHIKVVPVHRRSSNGLRRRGTDWSSALHAAPRRRRDSSV